MTTSNRPSSKRLFSVAMFALLAGACTGQTATPTRTAGSSATATFSTPSVTPRPTFAFPSSQTSGANPYTAAGGPFGYDQKAPFRQQDRLAFLLDLIGPAKA
jgi:hypothetical protein